MLRKIFIIELKFILRWSFFFILFLFMALICYFVQSGINNYRSLIKEQNEFIDSENIKALIHNNFIMYGAYGIQFYLMPDTSYILCQYPNANMAYIDSGARLSIFKNKKNYHGLTRLDFKDIISIIPYVLFIYGATSNRKKYNRFIRELLGEFKVFFSVLLTKSLIALCLLVFIITVINGQAIINNISFGDLFPLWISIYAIWIFFLSFGTLVGLIRKRVNQVVISVLFCISCIVIPYLINEVINEDHDFIKTEILNLNDLMSLEKNIANKYGANIGEKDPAIQEKVIEAIENGQKNEYKKIGEREIKACERFIKETKSNHILSALFPTSFIRTMFNEISSTGDISLWKFNNFAQQKKRNFLRYYIERLAHFIKTGDSKINRKPFKDSNIYASKRKYPYSFPLGLLLSLSYTFMCLIIAFYLFKKTFVSAVTFSDIQDIPLNCTALNSYLAKNEELIEFILNAFHEKSPVITLNNEPISNQKIIYLPDLSKLPNGSERFLNIEFSKDDDVKWKEYLQAAFNIADIVITTWNLDEFSDEQINYIKSVSEEKYYINIGFCLQTWLHRSNNRLFWKGDPDIKKIKPY